MKKYFEKVISRFKEDEEGICELEELYQKENRKIEIQKENKLNKTEKRIYGFRTILWKKSEKTIIILKPTLGL